MNTSQDSWWNDWLKQRGDEARAGAEQAAQELNEARRQAYPWHEGDKVSWVVTGQIAAVRFHNGVPHVYVTRDGEDSYEEINPDELTHLPTT